MTQILTQIENLSQIDSIFIFDWEQRSHDRPILEYSKLIGVFQDFDMLSSSIEEQMEFLNEHFQTFSFFDQNEYLIKDLSKHTANLLWYQLYHDVLSQPAYVTGDALQTMIHEFRSLYRENSKTFETIENFAREYRSDDALQWYLKKTFLYRTINKALKVKDIDQLYVLKSFMKDVTQCFIREHRKLIETGKEKLIVYRGMKLSRDQIEKFTENLGQLISTNGILITTSDHLIAMNQIICNQEKANLCSILLKIECDLLHMNGIDVIADLEEEYQMILFNSNATFQLVDVKMNEEITLIQLILSNESQTMKEKYINDSRRRIANISLDILFGQLMCDMGLWNQSQHYLEYLLNGSQLNNEDLAQIEYSLGDVYQLKAKWYDARKYYDRAYQAFNMQITYYPSGDITMMESLNNIGDLLFDQKQYNDALSYYQQALTICQTHAPYAINSVAFCMNNIGIILCTQQKYAEALEYHQKALNILENKSSLYQTGITDSLCYIGDLMIEEEKYSEARDYYRKALTLLENYLASPHINIADILNRMGHVLYHQRKYDEAIELYQQSLSVREKLDPDGNIDMATVLT
ncbi:unnamed protein product, partial [Rotaria sordida]